MPTFTSNVYVYAVESVDSTPYTNETAGELSSGASNHIYTGSSRAACNQACLDDEDCAFAAFNTNDQKCYIFYDENSAIISGPTYVLYTKNYKEIPSKFCLFLFHGPV